MIAAIVDPIKRTRDLWLYDVSRGVPTRLSFSDADDVRPVWAPDGQSIAFDSASGGTFDIYRKNITGTGAEQVIVNAAINERPFSWSSDGRYLIYESGSPKTPDAQFGDVWVIPFFDPRVPFAFLSTSFTEVRPLFSPDGSLVMYESDESGRNEVYVVRFPDGSGKVRVSQNGGSWTRWARDGREIFYLTADNTMMTVPISSTGGSIHVGTPSPLFKTRAKRVLHPYDVSPDGRFLINTLSEDTGRVPITLAVNWPATLE